MNSELAAAGDAARLRAELEATREILDSIRQLEDDESPVFAKILKAAAEFCRSDHSGLALVTLDRKGFYIAAGWGEGKFPFRYEQIWPLSDPQPVPTVLRSGTLRNIPNLKETELYQSGDPILTQIVEASGNRSWLVVPLIKDGIAIGALSLSRNVIERYTDDEVALVESFAAQAVIAIDTVRQFKELQARLEREAATREILEVISKSRDDDKPVFDVILRKAMALCGATQSGLLLGRKGGDQLTLAALQVDRMTNDEIAQAMFDVDNPPQKVDPEEHIAAQAICEARVVQVEDLAKTKQYLSGNPTFQLMVDDMASHTMISVPLMDKDGALGAINLHREEIRPFTEDVIELVKGFAAQAAIAVENVRQFKALESLNVELGDRVEEQVGEIERMGRLKRFLPAAVADTVVSSGKEDLLSSHRALLGILFCDIRGFTAFCESAEPEETIEVLQTYHQEMGKLIAASGAGVDHRMGDGIMVLFNDPVPCDDPAGEAVRLAMAMRDRMEELCEGWKRLGHRLGFGVGVSLGYATVGMVGYEGRFDYTASGTAVNLAARLCDKAEDKEILISPRAQVAVEDTIATEPHAELALKGISAPVEVFRLIGVRP